MKSNWFNVIALATLTVQCVANSAAHAQSSMEQFERAPVFKSATWPCPGEEAGFWQASCTNLELGDVSGYISPVTMESDARGKFLSKYWGTGEYLKFVVNGCARASTQEEAKSLASFRAHELIKKITGDFETDRLQGKYKALGYRKYDARSVCTARRSSTSTSTDQIANKEAAAEATRAANAARADRERQRATEAQEQRETTLLVEVRSFDPHTLELGFFSQTNTGRAWPGGDQVYLISDHELHTYRLTCQRGEKICFGAWRRGNTNSYWGGGYAAREGCTNCCLMCGSQHTYNLNANSEDSTTSSTDALNTLGTVLGALSSGLNAANALNGGSVSTPSVNRPSQTYRPPARPSKGHTNGSSDITGTR